MKQFSTRSLVSHLAAVGIGGLCALAVGTGLSGGKAPEQAEQRAERRAREAVDRSGSELLDKLQRGIEQRRAESDGARHDDLMKRYAELSKTLARSADPAATFRELVTAFKKTTDPAADPAESNHAEAMATLGVRYAQWFQQNPKAALAGIVREVYPIDEMFRYFIRDIASAVYQKQGLRVAMDWLAAMPGDVNSFELVGDDVGGRSSVADLTWLLENHPEFAARGDFSVCAGRLGKKWSLDDRDLVVPLLKGRPCSSYMFAIAARMKGTEGVEWLRSWSAGDTLDPTAKSEITSPSAHNRLAYDYSRPGDERLATIRLLGMQAKDTDERILEQIGEGGVGRFFSGSDTDWLYAFRHKQLSAGEVVDAAIAASPPLGAAEGKFRNHLFRQLAEDDAEAALAVLGPRPQDEKERQTMLAARWAFVGVDPDRFYQVISSVPVEGDAERTKVIKRSWLDKSARNLERFGEDYLTWVKTLPEGQQRTWALESVQEASKRTYPWISTEAKTLLEVKR